MSEPTLLTCMTPFPYTVEIDAGLESALAMMEEHDIRHMPVTRRGDLVGIVSHRYLTMALAVVEGKMVEGKMVEGKMGKVEDVARIPAYVTDCHTPFAVVLREMAETHYGSALITRSGKLCGILTMTDVCEAMADLLDPPKGPPEVA